MPAAKVPRSVSWRAVTAGYAAGLVSLGALTLRAADEPLYDVDSAHLQRMQPAVARQHAGNVSPLIRTQPLPSSYSASTTSELRFEFEPVLPSSSDCAPSPSPTSGRHKIQPAT